MYQPFGQHPLHPVSAVSETSTTCHLILKTTSTDLPLTALYITAYSLLGSITRHPQCLIAECQQILPVLLLWFLQSLQEHASIHSSPGKDIFEHFGSLYLCSRGGSDHGLQLELVLVRKLWAQYPHHRQINHDQLVPPPPDWQLALAPQAGLILGTQHLLFERILCGRKHSCCFVSGGCQHVVQFINCIEIFGFLPGSDTTV